MDKEILDNQIRCISHEIRNNISICSMYSEIIRKHIERDMYDNAAVNNAITCIQNSLKLIGNALLDMNSFKKFNPVKISVCDLIVESVELSKVYAIDKNIDFDVDIVDSAMVFIDKEKFKACLINLIKNAIEAINLEGYIKITANKSGENLSLRIRNNGEKIDNNLQKYIFDIGITTKSFGSGIGLYICKNNLLALNATLSLVASDDDYTEFEILLPLA